MYLRLPMPYLVAKLTGQEQNDGTRVPAPFTTNAMVDGQLMHYVDYDAVFADPLQLGKLAADGHRFLSDDVVLSANVAEVRVYRGLEQPPFSTLQEARLAFAENNTVRIEPSPFVGDTVVDILLKYRPGYAVSDYALSSTLNPGLEGQSETANLVVDYYGSDQQIFRISGLLHEPVQVRRSVIAAGWTFVQEGVRHILKGYDHVLFVMCLTLGALAFAPLAWRVTGFTVGHSITLSLGFFGFTPAAEWFIPAVEAGIAISIIVVAIAALAGQSQKHSGFITDALLTGVIGLLHGLGFSFVLQEILGVTSPNIWTSLLAFNVGVEIGQLAIVLMLWPLLWIVSRRMPTLLPALKWLIAVPCIALASLWTGQRLSDTFSAIVG